VFRARVEKVPTPPFFFWETDGTPSCKCPNLCLMILSHGLTKALSSRHGPPNLTDCSVGLHASFYLQQFQQKSFRAHQLCHMLTWRTRLLECRFTSWVSVS
jgi:hypothetical protein